MVHTKAEKENFDPKMLDFEGLIEWRIEETWDLIPEDGFSMLGLGQMQQLFKKNHSDFLVVSTIYSQKSDEVNSVLLEPEEIEGVVGSISQISQHEKIGEYLPMKLTSNNLPGLAMEKLLDELEPVMVSEMVKVFESDMKNLQVRKDFEASIWENVVGNSKFSRLVKSYSKIGLMTVSLQSAVVEEFFRKYFYKKEMSNDDKEKLISSGAFMFYTGLLMAETTQKYSELDSLLNE